MAIEDIPSQRGPNWHRLLKTRALQSGLWVPVFSSTVNLDSDPTILRAMFGYVGNLVVFQLALTIDPTAGAVAAYEFTLPNVPKSNFAGVNEAVGVALSAATNGLLTLVAASVLAKVDWTAPDGTATTQIVMGSYLLTE